MKGIMASIMYGRLGPSDIDRVLMSLLLQNIMA